MNYKSDSNKIEDITLFRCECMEYFFMEFSTFEWDNTGKRYFFTLIKSPKSFKEKLHYLFRNKDDVEEIMLNKEDVKILSDSLIKELKD